MKLTLLTLLGVVLGFCTVLLLPLLFVIALEQFILATREPHSPIDPVQCDGGDVAAEEGMTRLVEFLMEARRQAWINKVETDLHK